MVEEAGHSERAPDVVIHVEDRLLLQRHLRGDEAAFGQLLSRLGPAVWAVVCRAGVSDSEREDVYQEVFVKVHRAAASYQPDRPLKPWVLTIAANTARSWHRQRTVRKLLHLPEAPDRATDDPSSQQVVEGRESARWLTERIGELPPPQGEVLLLCSVEGLPQKDVADQLGLPVNTLKTHLRRARLALADALQRRTLTQDREAGR